MVLSRRNRPSLYRDTRPSPYPQHLVPGDSRYSPRPAAAQKLDPYKAIIDSRLDEFPGLSAQRLFDEVRAAGYPGGYTQFSVAIDNENLPRARPAQRGSSGCRRT